MSLLQNPNVPPTLARRPLSPRTLSFCVRFGAALLMLSNQVRGEVPSITIPPDCGSVEAFHAEVHQRLGPHSRARVALLNIAPEPSGGFLLRMQVGNESRELRDLDCRALFRAAIVVAVAVTLSETADHHAESQQKPPAQPTPTVQLPEPAPPVAVPAPGQTEAPPVPQEQPLARAESNAGPPIATTPPSSGREVSAMAGVGLNLGLQPQPALVVEVEARLRFLRGFGVGLAGRYLAPNARQDDAGHGFRVDSWGAQLGGTYSPIEPLEVQLGAAGYRLHATGFGTGGTQDTVWAFGPSAGVRYVPILRNVVSLSIGVDLHWNLLRPRFEIMNYGPVFLSSEFDASLFVRVGPRFR